MFAMFKNKFNNNYYWTDILPQKYDYNEYWSNEGQMFHCNGDGIFWDCHANEVDKEPVAYFDDGNNIGVHICRNSIFIADTSGEGKHKLNYIDELQNEYKLSDDALYIVLYHKYKVNYGLLNLVDFGITKEEIIDNVNAQKYIEGALYFTIDQMFRADNCGELMQKLHVKKPSFLAW